MVERLLEMDVEKVAQIASENFSGLKDYKNALEWLTCNFKAFPRMQYYVAISERENISVFNEYDIVSRCEIVGYILWMEKGGFRKESIWELEQIAIKKGFQGRGIGSILIRESLEKIKKYLKGRGSSLKIIEVTTGAENLAQNLYEKTLGANVECGIQDLFRGDEVIMIARFNKS